MIDSIYIEIIDMPVAYSDDLRWRIVWLHVFLRLDANEVARMLFVSERSVYRYSR